MRPPRYVLRREDGRYIRDTLKCDEGVVLVGHSSGAVAALRIAEEQKLRVGGLFFERSEARC